MHENLDVRIPRVVITDGCGLNRLRQQQEERKWPEPFDFHAQAQQHRETPQQHWQSPQQLAEEQHT